MQAPDYSFARRPKWMLSHVLVLALLVAMLGAFGWQVNRHQSRGERNDLIRARAEQPAVDLGEVAPPGSSPDVGQQQEFRKVVLTGEYQLQDEVLIRNRTFDGAPGWHVLTPLRTEEGWAVAVNRGWIPLTYKAEEPRPGTEPASGQVKVTGWVQPARVAEGFQVADPSGERLATLGRADVVRLAEQLDYPLSPVVLQLGPVDGEEFAQPAPLPLPTLDSGPHLSYAVQWLVFSTIAMIGYPLVLRRVARGRAASLPE